MITPLIEIPQIAWNYIEEKPAKTINQHLSKVPDQLIDSWGIDDIIFLDMALIAPDERMVDGKHPLTHIFDEVRSRGLKLIPVTSPSRDGDYQRAVKNISAKDKRGICLRLKDEDFDDDDLVAVVTNIKNDYKSHYIHVVLDFADISGENPRRLSRYINDIIRDLNSIHKWASLTFAASSFPRDLSIVPSSSIETIFRKEWDIWKAIVCSVSGARKPSFGDYAIQHPEPSEVDPRIMMMSASIRYTLENEWLILKARSVRRHGHEQYHQICQALTADPRFKGKTFSWGDEYISKCAKKENGPGNATTWRRVGTSHHIKLVCEQISNLP